MADAVLARPPPSRCVCCSTAAKVPPISSTCAFSELPPRNRPSVCSSSYASCEPLLTARRRKLNGGRSRQYEREWDCWRISLLPRKLHCTSRGHKVCADAGGAQADDEPWNPVSEDEAIRIQAQEELCRESTSGRVPGGVAHIEAFCRIYRGAEELHATVLDAVRNLNSDGLLVNVPDVEEAVVVGLARMAWVLDDGREQLFGGKFFDVPSWKLGRLGNGGKVSPDPVAQFREEMLKCCDALQVGLTTLMALSLDRNAEGAVHRGLDRLRNVCVDAGAPRAEGAPSPGDIPNFAVVDLVSGRGQSKPEPTLCRFWRGGQMTDTGLEWLLQRGFKLLIDLRDGNERSLELDPALSSAAESGRVQVVRIPVAAGAAPSRDQVKEFAGLVGSMKDDEVVLFSRTGVRRPCSMVARWREFALQGPPGSSLDFTVGVDGERVNGVPAIELPTGAQPVGEVVFSEVSNTSSGRDASVAGEQLERIKSGSRDDVVKSLATAGNGAFPFIVAEETPFRMVASPFEAQRPGPDAFTKKGMATFFKRKISPPLRPSKLSQGSSAGRSDRSKVLTNSENIAGAAGKWGPSGPGIPIAGSPVEDAVSSVTGSLSKRSENGFASPGVDADTSAEQLVTGGNPQVSDSLTGTNGNGASFPTTPRNGALVGVGDNYQVLDDVDDPVPVQGDMCASTTGVVRVQSRKKAEMYLVRTDGFSCTRERVMESTLAFTHPSTQQQMLMWKTPPKTVLLLKKLGTELMEEAEQVATFLHNEGMNVMVEPEAHDLFARSPGYGYVQTFYNQDAGELHERVDFVICLGGDGVILHASNLFRNAVPPVVSFNLGSLGFLTAHPFENFRQALRAIIHGNSGMGVYITLRMRLRCELFREGNSMPGKVFEVLNEVVVDRGSNPYLSKIECYERNRLITKVQADGVLVATPTGSTAYSTAAGGSMVHPNVPCMLFTPICPHSLSFRPVILPDSALLELKVPSDARNNAWVSFDGKKRQQLRKGDSVRIGMSPHPVPTVNKSDQTNDWFSSLVRCLNWNERREQKALSPS